jgi:iron complex outermembrane receptor protein
MSKLITYFPFMRFTLPCMPGTFTFCVLLFVVTAPLALQPAATAAEIPRRTFNIPAGAAAHTLKRFSEQSGCGVIVGATEIEGIKTNAVAGKLTASEALGRLLAGTGLLTREDALTGAFAISRPATKDTLPHKTMKAPPLIDDNPMHALPDPTRNRSITLRSLAAIVAGFASTDLSAQTAANSDPKARDPVELSPFVVNAAADNGYAATETLSGTRLRTDLRDVGSALAIITPQFMADLGINAPEDALLYTPSVDTPDYGGRASGLFTQGQAFTTRGFSNNGGEGAASSADFFQSLVSNDNYNLERVSLSRGPNSMLFGVGDPIGVAEQTVKRGRLDKNITQTKLQTDRWGSKRFALDHNHVLRPNKLALRLNGLIDRNRGFRDDESSDQDRLTLGLTFKPFENTKISLTHENYRIDKNIQPLGQVFDAGVIQWLANGSPTVDFKNTGVAWTNQNTFDPKRALAQTTGSSLVYVNGLGLAKPVQNWRFQGSMQADVRSGSLITPKDPWSLFHIATDANLYGGTVDDPSHRFHGNWTHLIIEQKLAKDLYLEAAGSHVRHRATFTNDNYNNIGFDVNKYMPDGNLNPGYLLPYSSFSGQFRFQNSQVKEYRANLSYQLDLTERSQWLGKHSFSALGQTSSTDFDSDVSRVQNQATPGITGWNSVATNGVHALTGVQYFVNGRAVGRPPSQRFLAENLAALNAQGNMVGATAALSSPVNFGLFPFINSTKSRNEVDSASFGWQAKWLKDRLVTTFGVRQDKTASYGVGITRTAAPSVANSATDVNRQYFALAADTPLDTEPSVTAQGTSRTYGVVAHATTWLDLAYNRSENFLPVANASWITFAGTPAPNSRGQTEEYTARLYLLKNKLSVSLARFKNSANNQAAGAAASTAQVRLILERIRTNYQQANPFFSALAPANTYPADNAGGIADTNSRDAKGYEATVVFNPTRDWRISLSASSNTNTLGLRFPGLTDYIGRNDLPFQGVATYQGYVNELQKVAAGQASSMFTSLNPNSATDRSLAQTDATYIATQLANYVQNWEDGNAVVGTASNTRGKYAFNGVFTYTVPPASKLSGWAFGGNFRYRTDATLGYQRRLDAAGLPTGTYDPTKPFIGGGNLDLGGMISYRRKIFKDTRLQVQLNIQNLLNDTDPILVSIDTDPAGYWGAPHNSVPIRYEMRRPRNFVLSATFDF